MGLIIFLKQVNTYLSLFFSLLILVNAFAYSMVVLEFTINQDYYAANLCVEKDVIESDCNGECYLEKTVKKTSEDKPVGATMTEVNLSGEYFQDIPAKTVTNFDFIISTFKPATNSTYASIGLGAIFQPPRS